MIAYDFWDFVTEGLSTATVFILCLLLFAILLIVFIFVLVLSDEADKNSPISSEQSDAKLENSKSSEENELARKKRNRTIAFKAVCVAIPVIIGFSAVVSGIIASEGLNKLVNDKAAEFGFEVAKVDFRSPGFFAEPDEKSVVSEYTVFGFDEKEAITKRKIAVVFESGVYSLYFTNDGETFELLSK